MSDLQDFLCVVPDVPGTLNARLEVRSEHLANAKRLGDEGVATFAGAMVKSHTLAEGASAPDFLGSTLVVKARDHEHARELLSKDVYVKKGVWDLANAQIYAFKRVI
ncbi:hypothetical protein PYCC9005_005275 [Savitreella phatthalungensis]